MLQLNCKDNLIQVDVLPSESQALQKFDYFKSVAIVTNTN